MNGSINLLASSADCVTFGVWIAGQHYSCPISRAVLYELCKDQAPEADRIDAYLSLKEKILGAAQQRLSGGGSDLSELFDPWDAPC